MRTSSSALKGLAECIQLAEEEVSKQLLLRWLTSPSTVGQSVRSLTELCTVNGVTPKPRSTITPYKLEQKVTVLYKLVLRGLSAVSCLSVEFSSLSSISQDSGDLSYG